MDINASIIDQQLTGLLEKHSDWLPLDATQAARKRTAPSGSGRLRFQSTIIDFDKLFPKIYPTQDRASEIVINVPLTSDAVILNSNFIRRKHARIS